MIQENKIGLFYGSDTGITEEITNILVELWKGDEIEVHEIIDAKPEDFNRYKVLFLGLSTWYDGDLQSDWESFFEDFKTIDFTRKTVAIYGLGDQYGYAEYFIDGVGILAKVVLENGGKVIGYWSSEEYDYTESVADIDEDYFYGLALDHDNQQELTEPRLEEWLTQISKELEEITRKEFV